MVAKQSTSTPRGTNPAKAGATPAKAPPARGLPGAAGRAKAPNIATFFQEARAELKKVTWPTRQETMNLTGAVIAMTVGIAAFLGVIDTTLDYLVKPLIGAK